jgi:putative glutathione S-transferase
MNASAQFAAEASDDGRFVRQQDAFRDWISADGHTGYPAVAGRYHLYVSLACPWAHRTIVMRSLQRLEKVIGMTVVDPVRDDRGWAFRDGDGYSHDPVNGFAYLSEAYLATDPGYDGRVTVPALWDTKTKRIVSNSDDDILRMFETQFSALARCDFDFYPAALGAEIDRLNDWIYETK